MERPNLEDFEFYDPQSMQEYAYLVENYIDELESLLNETKADIKEE